MLLAVGAKPNDDLAAAAGLPCQDGIVVDEHGHTADAAIYAAGDCTRFPSRRYGRKLRLECVQNAIDQAKAVAVRDPRQAAALRSGAVVLVGPV